MPVNEYTDVHRRFMQSFLAAPCQTIQRAKVNYALCYQETSGQALEAKEVNINDVMEVVNEQLKLLTMTEIKRGKCEVTGVQYFVLINTMGTPWIKNVSPYNENEQKVFAKILDEILKNGEGYVSSTTCLNIGTEYNPPISQSAIEKILKKFIGDSWFVDKEGRIYISVRCAMELEGKLSEVYEIPKCVLCKKSLFYGLSCSSCAEQGHQHCLNHYFASPGMSPQCPSCNVPWPTGSFEETQPIQDSQEEMEIQSRQSPQPGPSRRRSQR